MQELKDIDIKRVGKEILHFIDSFCRQNNLNYCIGAGTLLGAVRHKGFIPWDDDIDVYMMRDDYQRFIELMQRQDDYRIISMETDSDYYFSFARVADKRTKLILNDFREIHNLGVFVDVWPIDVAPLPNERKCWREEYEIVKRNMRLTIPSTAKYEKRSFKKAMRDLYKFPRRLILKIYGFDQYRKRLVALETKFNHTENPEYMVAASQYKDKAVFDRNVFDAYIDMQFEDISVKAPVGWKTFLTNLYGDYMKLPPKEKQVSQHHFKAYWL